MRIPRDLGGRELADARCRRWDYKEVQQSGSPIILRRKTPHSREWLFLRIDT